MSEHEPELQRTLTRTSDGGWPTEYLDWLKKDQGFTCGRQEMSPVEKAVAAVATEAQQEFKAMSAQLSTEEKARKDLERGSLDAPLLGGSTKDLGRYSRSSIKGKLVVLGLLLLVLCWLSGGGHEVGQWYTVERAREERAEATLVAAKAAAAERVAEQAKEEKVAEGKEAAAEKKEAAAEEKEAAEERDAANEAAAEKAAGQKAAWVTKMRDGVIVALVIVDMLLVVAAVDMLLFLKLH